MTKKPLLVMLLLVGGFFVSGVAQAQESVYVHISHQISNVLIPIVQATTASLLARK